CAAALLLLGSCYKDQGNYTYLPFGDVQISFLPNSNFPATIGSEFTMTSSIRSISTGDSTEFENPDLYDYEWNVNGEVIGTDKNFEGMCMLPTAQARGLFSVINKKTKERAMATFVVNVVSSINIGWMILSEKDNK